MEITKTTDTLRLQKDSSLPYVHIRLNQARHTNVIDMQEVTYRPADIPLPLINRTVVFVKREHLQTLLYNGILTDFFVEPVYNVICGFLTVDIYLEVVNAPNQN